VTSEHADTVTFCPEYKVTAVRLSARRGIGVTCPAEGSGHTLAVNVG
jgi:hypothetical protein